MSGVSASFVGYALKKTGMKLPVYRLFLLFFTLLKERYLHETFSLLYFGAGNSISESNVCLRGA